MCYINDRVALLVWLKHKLTRKDILIISTHLTFPHNSIDRIMQMKQIKRLTDIIDNYSINNNIYSVTRIILGDFNVQKDSSVCNHLKNEGYYSCTEVMLPNNVTQQNKSIFNTYSNQNNNNNNENEYCDIFNDIYSNEINNSINNNQLFEDINELKYVSHRTHRNEDLGVDHIFIKPEYLSKSEIDILTDDTIEISSQSLLLENNKQIGSVFIAGTEVIPANMPCNTWNDAFAISDHRPVGAKIVFGTLIK